MNEKTLPTVIPQQQQGAKTDIVELVDLKDEADAKNLFAEAKKRLLDVGNWHKLCGTASATFKLTDNSGNEITSNPQTGHFFMINIPGPGPATGDGFDWVKIEMIEESANETSADEIVAIRVKPAGNPLNENSDTAHFFSDEATSSFIVQRSGTKVTAEVHGRNEKPNTKADALIDRTRNALVASGAVIGFSEVQWKSLAKGLLAKTN